MTTNPDYSSLSASSVWANEKIGHLHGQGKLDSTQGWSAGHNTKGQWWQIDLGRPMKVQGVVTQGRTAYDQYVKSYQVKVSNDGHSWQPVDGGKTFAGNSAANNAKKENWFVVPVTARYVRFVVESWKNHISMRAAVLTCKGS